MSKEAVAVASGLSAAQADRAALLLLAMAIDVDVVEKGPRRFSLAVAAGDADRAAELIREEFPYGIPGGTDEEPGMVDGSARLSSDAQLASEWFGRGTGVVLFITLACGFLFFSLAADGGPTRSKLIDYGAISWALVEEGQYWRLASAIFIHFDVGHLVANMVAFLLLAPPLVQGLGPWRFVLLFLVAGVSGNVLSHELAPAVGLKAGASGAIAGVLGGLAGSALRPGRATRFRSWQVLAALAAIYGLLVGFGPGRDNIAHLGGLFTGLLLGRVIEPEPLDEPSPAGGSEPRAPQHRFR